MVSQGSMPKKDGNNSVAQSAIDLQGMEVERPYIHGMVGHVINSLHQAVVESDKTWMENLRQSEVTMLDDHARCKENSKKEAQWAGKHSVKAIWMDCESL